MPWYNENLWIYSKWILQIFITQHFSLNMKNVQQQKKNQINFNKCVKFSHNFKTDNNTDRQIGWMIVGMTDIHGKLIMMMNK